MYHKISIEDSSFLDEFESCTNSAANFHHSEHIQLAYILLVKLDVDRAYNKLKKDLLSFLSHNGVDESKFHVTITKAWLLAVNHFMHISKPYSSAAEFIGANSILLNIDIMYTHYTKELLHSELARSSYFEPNIQEIPTHNGKMA